MKAKTAHALLPQWAGERTPLSEMFAKPSVLMAQA
jgi:hypothetical protein